MLAAFLSRKSLENFRLFFLNPDLQQQERLDTIWLLSTQAFDVVKKGEVFFTVQSWGDHPDTTRIQTVKVSPYLLGPLILTSPSITWIPICSLPNVTLAFHC